VPLSDSIAIKLHEEEVKVRKELNSLEGEPIDSERAGHVPAQAVVANGQADARAEGRSSRLGMAIMRILASARGATEGRRTVTTADLTPSRLSGHGSAGHEEERHEREETAGVEWTLRMMQ
jgi:hypothetical protein